jgi:peptidoglycan/LPS O-acetylase OafA/YrhL
LIAPFILNKSNRVLIGLVFVGLLLRMIPYGYHSPIFAGIDCFAMGALAYRQRELLQIDLKWSRKTQQNIVFIGILLLLISGVPPWEIFPIGDKHNTLDVLIYPMLFALLIPTIFSITADIKIDRMIGELSYPFYIFHALVISILSKTNINSSGSNGQIFALTVILVTLVISFIALKIEMRWVEPARALLATPKQTLDRSILKDTA